MPRTSTRNHFSAIGRSRARVSFSVISGSKPNSSTSYSPVSRRRSSASSCASWGSHCSPQTSRAALCSIVQPEVGRDPAERGAVVRRRGRPRRVDPGGRRRHGLGRDLLDGLGGGRLRRTSRCARRGFGAGFWAAFAAGVRREAARGRGRLGAAGTSAGTAAGADRDDLGVSHGALPRCRRRAAGRPGRRRPARRCATTAGIDEAKSANASAVVYSGSNPSSVRIRVVSMPRPKVRKLSCSGEKSASRAWRSTEPSWPDGEAGQRHGRALQPAERLRQHQDAVAGDVERAGDVGEDGVLQHPVEVVLVDELHPGVVAEHGRDDGQPEVRRHRADHVGADHVGQPQHGDPDVGTPAGEAAHVALDLGGVLAEPGPGVAARAHLLGEHRRVARAGAVHGRGRLHDEVLDRRRLLARSEQLHGADDVELLHRAAAAGAAGRGDDAHVDDGVDVLLRDHLGDHGRADVGADERHRADVAARRDHVDPDHAVDAVGRRQAAREAATEVTRDPGDERDPAHGGSLRPSVGTTCRACGAGRASSSAACGASSSPCACDAS